LKNKKNGVNHKKNLTPGKKECNINQYVNLLRFYRAKAAAMRGKTLGNIMETNIPSIAKRSKMRSFCSNPAGIFLLISIYNAILTGQESLSASFTLEQCTRYYTK
jgi:hypothetical protein